MDLQAELSGTYTVLVGDLNGTGSGTYQLNLAQVPGAFEVAAGDDGGELTNGATHQGAIVVGDFDLWTIQADSGDRLVVQIAEVTGGAAFTPMIELFGPDGARLSGDTGGLAARLDVQTAVGGVYTVQVSDFARTGAGSYELRLALVPDEFVVPAGDEGGATNDGENHDGAVTLGDLDAWTFMAVPGDLVTVQVTEQSGGAGFAPLVEVFDASGDRRRAVQHGSIVTLDVAVTEGGRFTVLISDSSKSGAGTYRLNVNRSVIGPAAANVLVNGETQLGSISAAGETNSWTFTATAGESLIVRMGETGTGAFVPWLRLYDPSGVLLNQDFNAAAAEVAARATNSGTFLVSVADGSAGRNQTGDYRISLAKTGSALTIAPLDEGGSLTNGASYLAAIDVGDLDAWSFTANSGESIAIWVGESSTGTSLLPWLRLYGPDGTPLAADFNASAAEVTARATNSGVFLAVVADGNNGLGGSGNYRISMAKTGIPLEISPVDEGGALTNGASYLSALDVGDVDAWTFTANAGQSIAVWVGESSTGTTLLPWLRLFGPDGSLLAADFNASAAEVTVRATNSGTFLVVVSDGNNGRGGSGNYRLSLARTGSALEISPADEGGALINGTSYLATIDVGDVDAWTVNAVAGETIVARMGESSTGTTLLPWLRLFGPDGSLLSADFNASAAEVTARATNSGVFLLVVGDGNSGRGGSGDYRLSAVISGSPVTISAGDEGGEVINGSSYLATIEVGDIDGWTFSADVGENILVRMGETAAGSTLLPWLRLYGPDGVLLDADFNAAAAEVSFRATNSGIFTVVATDGNSALGGTGNYRLSMAKAGSPLSISDGDEGGPMDGSGEYEGTIDIGDVDAWTFTACAGETISLSVTELVAGSPLNPWIRLYGWNGELLRSSFGAASGQITNFVAPASGTYTVVVGDGSSTIGAAGTYRLSANGLLDQLRFCPPFFSGDGGTLMAIGGVAHEPFTLLSSTDAGLLLSQWTPLVVGQFDLYGVVTFTNVYDPAEDQRFFVLQRP
jgi:predicted RNA-binding protein with TRAM domain